MSGRVTLNKTWSWDDIKRNKLDKTTEAAAKAKDMESARMKVTGTKKTMLKFYKNELPRLKGLHVGSPFEQQSDPGNPWILYVDKPERDSYIIPTGETWSRKTDPSTSLTPIVNVKVVISGNRTDTLVFNINAFAADMAVSKNKKQYKDIVNCSMKYLVHVNRQHEFSDEVYDTHIDAPQNNTSIISMNPSRISPVVNFKIKTKQVRKANGNPEEDSYFIGVNIHIKDDKK